MLWKIGFVVYVVTGCVCIILICFYFITGIHVLNRSHNNKLSYLVYNLSTAKVEQDSTFPTDTQAFLGASESNIMLQNGGEVTK